MAALDADVTAIIVVEIICTGTVAHCTSTNNNHTSEEENNDYNCCNDSDDVLHNDTNVAAESQFTTLLGTLMLSIIVVP